MYLPMKGVVVGRETLEPGKWTGKEAFIRVVEPLEEIRG